ncbi:hypothetical protein GJ744_006906 [Endocarpon pusillum]|uniref:Uncharacterized protein n=1 Tax=Endocarpon pusillum TaxID=364733 RepID=A0A8H7AJE8_9EURO|nr:hypothetical protein GJ744_006906 [Endocarpon pusillum]
MLEYFQIHDGCRLDIIGLAHPPEPRDPPMLALGLYDKERIKVARAFECTIGPTSKIQCS